MKRITFLITMCIMSLGHSQQQQYVFDFEDDGPDGTVTNWVTFEGSIAAPVIIDNPDLDGTNNTISKVLKVVAPVPGNFYDGVNNVGAAAAFGTWKIDAAVSSNLILSMDINKNFIGTVGIKMGTVSGGTTFQITDQNVGNNVVDEWQTLTWNLSPNLTGDITDVSQMVIFIDWRDGMPARTTEAVLHIDNITFNAEKLTDPMAPPVAPESSAPEPNLSSSQVYSVFSNAYTSPAPLYTFGAVSTVDLDMPSDNNQTYQSTLGFFGQGFPNVDLTAYTHIHFDYYTNDSSQFSFYPISDTPVIDTNKYTVGTNEAIETGKWVGVDMELSQFPDVDFTDWFQYKFDGNGTVYIDNIYFWNATLGLDSVEQISFKVYPNPAVEKWIVESRGGILNDIDIYNVLGAKVLSLKPNTSKVLINATSLKSGVYFAQIRSDSRNRSIKLIKK